MSSTSNFDIDISDDVHHVRRSRHLDGSWEWFQRMWGIAVIAHIVGNPAIGELVGDVSPRGVASFVLGLTAVAAVLRPDDRRFLAALAIGVPVTAALELPVLGNHWLLATGISIALGISLISVGGWAWFAQTGRAMFITFYGFAVFAKLNSDFFDPAASCAVVYVNQMSRAIGMPTLSSDSVLAVGIPFIVVLIEALVFALLFNARTRFAGVLLGLAFHSAISFDLDQHFYDFTSVLYPLLLLWLPEDRLEKLGEYLPERTQVVAGVTLSLFAVATVLPSTRVTSILLGTAFFLVWIPYALVIVNLVATSSVRKHDVAVRPSGAAAWLLVGLVALNGLTPYVELKTANSWNMYSNLSVVNGESNHLLVRAGAPLLGGHGDLIEIIATSDPGLSAYVGSDWRLTSRAFNAYVERHPAIEVEYRQGTDVITPLQTSAMEGQEGFLSDLAAFRAVDAAPPVQCQTVWLPAN